MTAARPAPPPTRRGGRWGWWCAAAVGLGLVAHGCHGADVDHEPGVAGPADRGRADADAGR